MADLTQMIRWNANFVRGLAQSVLERAKEIRGSLGPNTAEAPIFAATVKTGKAKRMTVKKAPKKISAKKSSKPVRKTKKANA
jgi:hypothetical protein